MSAGKQSADLTVKTAFLKFRISREDNATDAAARRRFTSRRIFSIQRAAGKRKFHYKYV